MLSTNAGCWHDACAGGDLGGIAGEGGEEGPDPVVLGRRQLHGRGRAHPGRSAGTGARGFARRRSAPSVARLGDDVVASVPDLITMVDHDTSSPINSERVHYGQRVTVFGIGCPPHYRTERALKVVEPRAFGFDFDFVPIEKL